MFIIGKTESTKLEQQVKSETECFQDILLTSVSESFRNLTLKTLLTFKWITYNMPVTSLFYVMVDDDCVVDLALTIEFLQNKTNEADKSVMYCGFQYESDIQPIRGFSKMSITWQQYPAKYLPDFCRGVMVILSYPMIVGLFRISKTTNYSVFPLEDVMIYGILRFKLGLQNEHIFPVVNGGKSLVFYPWDETSALPSKMVRKWKRIKDEDLFTSFAKRISSLGKCTRYERNVKDELRDISFD